MKTFKFMVVGFIAVVTVLLLLQAFAWKSVKDIEMLPYTVVHKYDSFEIRNYQASNFTKVNLPVNTYKEGSSMGFKTLAGYIFGKNERQEKIAMTSPVAMQLDEDMTMMFMVPADYDLKDLPTPNDERIEFVTQPSRTMAAISFSGWANDEKIKKYSDELSHLLRSHGIEHSGEFVYLGYNPPFELINRRNEIVVEVRNVIGLN